MAERSEWFNDLLINIYNNIIHTLKNKYIELKYIASTEGIA